MIGTNRVRYFLRQAFRSVLRSPLLQVVAISTTTVSMSVLCVSLVLASNLDDLADRWGRGLGIICFAHDKTTTARLESISETLRSWSEIQTTKVFSKQQAYDDLALALGDDRRLLDGLDQNALPASIEIVLDPAHRNQQARARVVEKLRQLESIDQVQKIDFGADMVSKISRLREYFRIGGFAIALLVLFAVVFIITNTARLALYARRDEIEVMRLVGAPNSVIRVPIYLEGAFQGLVGAGLALGLTWMLVQVVPMAEFIVEYDNVPSSLRFIGPELVVLVLMVAAFIGVGASHLATSRFLREQN